MDSVIVYNVLGQYRSKLACFDLDHTLIETRSKKVLPIDINDWQFKPFVIDTLQLLNKQDWSIIVFSNQKQCRAILPTPELKSKFSHIQTAIGDDIPITFFAALQRDLYRKPYTGMWHLLSKIVDNKYEQVFFCGDAFEKNRFDDIFFALNCEIPFIKPIDMFKDHKNNIIDTSSNHYTINFEPPIKFINEALFDKEKKELESFLKNYTYVFVISPPVSGKTTFCVEHLSGYLRLSKDDFSTKTKYMNAVTANKAKALVFDNTNHTTKSRAEIINRLPEGASVGYILRDIAKEECMYLNKYRCYASKYKIELLPDIAIHMYFKNLEVPDKNVIKLSHWISSLETRFCIN